MYQSPAHLETSDTAILQTLNATTDLHAEKVLIIDDDAASRLALAAAMREGGYSLVFATSAAEVRRRLPDIRPDAIVCDLMMDEMRGDEFIRWLKANERWELVPVIAVSQLNDSLVRVDLLDAGADAVLAKSAVRAELRAHVAAAMRTRAMFRRLRVAR